VTYVSFAYVHDHHDHHGDDHHQVEILSTILPPVQVN
jgi:hypothetical protein